MLKKTLRWLLRLVAGLFALAIVIFVAGVLINLGDAAITPETQALMSAPKYVADPDRNGYFVLRAMDGGMGSDVLKTGRILEEKYQKLYEENPNRSDYETQISYEKAARSEWKNGRCVKPTENCVEADLRKRAELESLIAQNALALRHYELIQLLPEFEEHAIPSVFAPLLKYEPLVQGSEMVLTKAAFEIADGRLKDGIDHLIKNDEFLRRLLRKTSTLLSRNIALAMMRKQTRMIGELVEIKPALVEQYGEALAYLTRPLRQEEQSFSTVYGSEARFASNYLKNVDAVHGLAMWVSGNDHPGLAARAIGKIFGLFYQPNATLNMVGASWSAILDEANQPVSEYSKVQARVMGKNRQLIDHPYLPYVHHLSNPVGKVVLPMAVVPEMYLGYMERSADVDGYLRLVGLQVDVRRKKIVESAMQDYANKAGAQFRSPYDGKPMTWVADKKQLQFVGRQRATSNLDGKNIFIAQMR